LKVLAAEAAVFVLAALPVLVWRFVYGVVIEKQPLDLSINPLWVQVVGNGTMHHLFYLFNPQFYILVVNAGGVAALGLFLIANRKTPSVHFASEIRWMAAGALLVLLVQLIAGYLLPITFILELQISRVSVLLMILCYLYFAHYLAQIWRARTAAAGKERPFSDHAYNLIAGLFFITQSAVFPLIAWFATVKGSLRSKVKTAQALASAEIAIDPPHIAAEMPDLRKVSPWVPVVCVLLGFGICVYLGASYGMWKPGVFIYPPASPWLDVQYWAKDNTSKDAVFITPPEMFNVYEPDWRVFSERSNVASLTDILEIALSANYLNTWLPRFNAIAPGAIEQFNGDYFHTRKVITQAYYSQSEDAILVAACQYHADYLVFEKPNQRNFPIIYQNNGFVVYDLTSVKKCGVAATPQN